MSSSNTNKYITPCRSFGLSRTHRRTPGSAGSKATKSVNSPFTSPLVAGERTIPCIEKKRSLSLNSLWSTPLISKSCVNMGLSKPSAKNRVSSSALLVSSHNQTFGGGATPCTPDNVKKEECNTKSSESISSLDTPGPSLKQRNDGRVKPKVLLFSGTNETSKTPLKKSKNVDASPTYNREGPDIIVKPDESKRPSNHKDHLSKKKSEQQIENGFLGWDSASEETIELNSRLINFKSFCENQTKIKQNLLSQGSNPTCSESESEFSTGSESSSSDLLGENCKSESKSVDEDNHDKKGDLSCRVIDKSAQVVLVKLQLDSIKMPPTYTNDEEGYDAENSVSSEAEDDESNDKWDFASSRLPFQETYTAKKNTTGKLSLRKQSSIPNSQEANEKCSRQTEPVQLTGECSGSKVDSKSTDSCDEEASSAEDFEKIKTDMRKWLEGGQRVILEIIEEVRIQKNREMSVMEVLQEQGIDPDLVGYDQQREEFITFEKFVVQNGIS